MALSSGAGGSQGLIPTFDSLFSTGHTSGGLVVRIISVYRSFLSPAFYTTTGITVVPGVDYTYDMDVCDGHERVGTNNSLLTAAVCQSSLLPTLHTHSPLTRFPFTPHPPPFTPTHPQKRWW